MQVANKSNKCFIVWSNGVEGRLDPEYYNPKFNYLFALLEKGRYKSVSLSEIATDIFQGVGKNETPEPNYILLKVKNILLNNKIDYSNTEFIKDAPKSKLLKKGDIISPFIGEAVRICKFSVFSKENNKYTADNNTGIIRINPEKANNEYVAIILNSEIGKIQIDKLIGGGGVPFLGAGNAKKFKIPLPPLEIQNKIVKIMQFAYDKKTDKEQKAENILNSVDDYILGELDIKMPEAQDKECFYINSQEVNKGRLDCYYYQPKFKQGEKSFKKANCKPEPLKNYITKIHYGASLKNNYVDEGIPLLRIQNLKPNRIVLADIVKISEARRKELGNAFVSEGDLLISRSGSVGIVSVVPKEAEGFAFGSFMIKFCLNDRIDKDFVSIWLNNKISQLFIKREKIGTIQGNITIETIENLQIPTPPLEIQKKLAGEVKERIAEAKKINSEAKNEIEKAKQEVESIILGK